MVRLEALLENVFEIDLIALLDSGNISPHQIVFVDEYILQRSNTNAIRVRYLYS